jgi:hypothetical protein
MYDIVKKLDESVYLASSERVLKLVNLTCKRPAMLRF